MSGENCDPPNECCPAEKSPVKYDQVDLIRFIMGMPDAVKATFTERKEREMACMHLDNARLWLEELRAREHADAEEEAEA